MYSAFNVSNFDVCLIGLLFSDVILVNVKLTFFDYNNFIRLHYDGGFWSMSKSFPILNLVCACSGLLDEHRVGQVWISFINQTKFEWGPVLRLFKLLLHNGERNSGFHFMNVFCILGKIDIPGWYILLVVNELYIRL